jgi:broad specificity phosphatase PhoE
LTPEGWLQAEDAGRRLKAMLRKEDTIRIFTSPYRRTRETTEGILRTLTADDDAGSSPFQRDDIKVYEEPRLREQDFGNFQPCKQGHL